MRRGSDVDKTIVRIANANNRVIPWRALKAAGIGHRAVEHRLAIGRLYRHHTGVYLLDRPEQAGRLTLLTAAVAACAPDALLIDRAAAELWELLGPCPGPIHVTVIGRNPGARAGIRLHRTRALDPRDIGTRHGIRVTSPARTIVDNARASELEEMIGTALVKRLVTERQIEQAIARCPTRPGVGRLRAILTQDGGPRRTRSWAERRLVSLIREAGLPVPLTNRLLHGYQVDAVWPDLKLVVEVDGYDFHRARRSFEADRARDATLVAHGYRVIRFTAAQLDREPLVVIGRLAAALALVSDTNARTSAE